MFGTLKGILAIVLALLNILVMAIPFFSAVFLKLIVPGRKAKSFFTVWVTNIARQYNVNNGLIFFKLGSVNLKVSGTDKLSKQGSYLVVSNHQSWGDIPALQYVLEKHIPFLKFFIKQELIYVPVLGVAWWALDFPFMKRYSREFLLKHPDKRGDDIRETKRMCRRFKGSAVSVMSFLEGTRYTDTKRKNHRSRFEHLLNPKVGGAALVMGAMGTSVKTLLDVTLDYQSDDKLSLWNLMTGKVTEINIHVRCIDIPVQFLGADYENDKRFRRDVKLWFEEIWQDKDRRLNSWRA